MQNTNTVRVTRHVEFEMAHLLPSYPGGCGNLHGHTYKIEVTLEGVPDQSQFGFVMDFKKLDAIIKSVVPDHKFVASTSAETDAGPEHDILAVIKKHGLAYEVLPFTTSAENMVGYFAEIIQSQLPEGINVCAVDLWETTNSHATWVDLK